MKAAVHRWVVTNGAILVRGLERRVGAASLVPNEPFLDPTSFPWTRTLEENSAVIRGELDRILARHSALPNFQDISTDQRHLTSDDRWKTFFFYAYGFRAAENCRRCPETAKVLERIPGMKTAFFSILSPGKKIPPHRGPFKGVIRAHLGLRIPTPEDACGIRVGGETRHWREGKVMVFDDTFDHEAWNLSDGLRVVLFIDIVRPLRWPMRWVNAFVLKAIGWSPFVQNAADNYQAWEREFDRTERATPAGAGPAS
ncbi:MAG: aspartyl/asparaginyl beta-hydroxylase domain-containing protein [Gemmatimonadetes bacterium]|nr:aspartyl/asparaginyl beta-hydroxylase domain-containing protein [Gemmatimonadota bacterium]